MNTENIQTENRGFKYFLKSNLKVISIFVFIIIFLGVGFLYSDYSDEKRRIKSSENYIEAKILITQEKTKRASEILKKNIENRDKTYSPLSLFLIIDQDLEKDKKHKVAKFKILKASVRAYQRNLNTHSSYKEFRIERAIQRDNEGKLNSLKLVNYLEKYAETGKEYTEVLKKIITQNNLTDFDDVEILPTSLKMKNLI